MKPAIPLHDPRFRYTHSSGTNLRKTFLLARLRLAREARKEKKQ